MLAAMATQDDPYYRPDLARAHHLGYGFDADNCAPGILSLLAPVQARGGLVLELGCGSGLLTRHLTDAGHRVIATDASPAMLDLARGYAPAADIRPLTLPGDPLPAADAVVSVGHVLSYLPDAGAAIARAVRPGGLFAIDLCDLAYGEQRRGEPPLGRVSDSWAVLAATSLPAPDRFVRDITIFTLGDGGCWRRDDERHENTLINTTQVPGLLAAEGVDVSVGTAFGEERQPPGLVVLIGRRAA